VREHLAALPHSQFPRELYWVGREPIFFRGRLDGTAKVLGVGQDPGVCEHVVGRTFVGTAGERVQYLLEALGLSESYVLVNTHQYEIRSSCANRALKRVSDSAISEWRNRLFDLITDERHLQAVIAFGKHAEKAVSLWAARPPSARVVNLKHPTSRNLDALAENWRTEYAKLRAAVWPDPGCQSSRPRFRQTFAEGHPASIPDGDLAA
jgi:uracil-DNA glycosylase family 4